ncbi:MAG: hypothetical protein H7098_10045 [Oligoflexus sp.]|nr:hypothetical protein [Pseudopedobacter sp.]
MNYTYTIRTLFKAILVSLFPLAGLGNVLPVKIVNLTDTVKYQKKNDKEEIKKEDPQDKQQPNKPPIIKVPKARKQERPQVVIKPNIKIKPIKIIRPNIKKP